MTEPPGAIFRERTTRWVIDAPREEVWRAWTEPERVAAWWGPRGMSVPLDSVEMDVRPGGVFRLTMVADASGAEFPVDMHYREVVPPERLAYAWEAQRGIGSGVVTVTFADLGERTEVTTHFAGFATDEIFTGAKRGWKAQMGKLDAYVGSGTGVEEVIHEREEGGKLGAVHVHEFMSLDGVIDAPTWTVDYEFLPEMEKTLGAVTDRCRAILLGRKTYEMFEPAWSTRTVEEDPGAPFFNDTTKYVVSGTLTEATWRNSEIIGPYDPGRLRRLKDEVDGDIYVSGSGTLVRAMLADGLIDELHLVVYPLTRGGGPRLFTEDAEPRKLSLGASEAYRHGVVYLNYRAQE